MKIALLPLIIGVTLSGQLHEVLAAQPMKINTESRSTQNQTPTPAINDFQIASISDVGVQLQWQVSGYNNRFEVEIIERPVNESPTSYLAEASESGFYRGHLTPDTQYEAVLKVCNESGCIVSETIHFVTLPERLAYNDSRKADNHLSGNLSAHINFAQTHTSVTPNSNTENRRPELVMSRNALLLVTPKAYWTNHLWLEILQDGVLVDKVTMNPPTAQPATDQVENERSTVVFSHHAWSAPINWRWMKPGLSLRLTDNFGRIGELSETDLTFGGEPELIINNIDIGMLTPPRNQYTMIKEMPKLAADYFQKIPVSKLVMVDYTPLHLTKVTLPNGKIYTERSDEDGGVHSGDMRGAIGKSLISMGINNANFGIPDSAGMTGSYARRTNIITAHNSIGMYANGVIRHGLSGGGGMVTLSNSVGNEWSHELSHNFGRGHHPHLASIHDETTGWGWDALYNRFIGNLLWNGEVKTMEWAGQIVPPFAGEFTFSNDSQAGGNTAFNGPISSYTHDHPAGTLKTQQWMNESQNIDAQSHTGYSRWDQRLQHTVSADVDFSAPIAVGVPVATILGIYDPTGMNPSQIYPLTYSNYGHVFDLPTPNVSNQDILQGWQHISTLSQADKLNTKWQTIQIDDQQQLLCKYQTHDQLGNQVTFVGYENGNVCQTSDDMKWRFDNAWQKIPTSDVAQYQLLSSLSMTGGTAKYVPSPELGERELCSLTSVGGLHDGAGYVENGKCRQINGIRHTNNASWSYGLKPNNTKVHVFKTGRQCQVDIEHEDGTTQSVAVHGERYDINQSNKFHINTAMDNPPKFVSVKCQLPNGESSLLDALEVKYNPEIETLNGPVIIGQEFDYQANESTLPSGWFTMPEGFDHTQLSKVEQTNLATLRKGDEYPYICRFSMMVNDSLKIVHGYVEQLSEGQYQCTGGNEITVRDNKGELTSLGFVVLNGKPACAGLLL
ncbi:M66 family metalloprotease [Vibrio vulnificus]